jgi:hypothetical protein
MWIESRLLPRNVMSDLFVVAYFVIGVAAFIIAACCYVPPNGSYAGYERDWSLEWFAFFLWPIFLLGIMALVIVLAWWRIWRTEPYV